MKGCRSPIVLCQQPSPPPHTHTIRAPVTWIPKPNMLYPRVPSPPLPTWPHNSFLAATCPQWTRSSPLTCQQSPVPLATLKQTAHSPNHVTSAAQDPMSMVVRPGPLPTLQKPTQPIPAGFQRQTSCLSPNLSHRRADHTCWQTPKLKPLRPRLPRTNIRMAET